MNLKEHPFFKAIDLAGSFEKKIRQKTGRPAWGCGTAKKTQFFSALKLATPFVFDKKTTLEKRFEGRSVSGFKNIVEDFSLPFKTSLYLLTGCISVDAPIGDQGDRGLFTVLGYLVHELTPERFQVFEVSWLEMEGKTLPSINQYEIDLNNIGMMNTMLDALRSEDDGVSEEQDRKPESHVFKETACIMQFTKAISVKRVGIEHIKSFSVKSGIGSGFTSVKVDRLYHIADKVEYDYTTKEGDTEINWEWKGFWRGHWRAFYVKDSSGNNVVDSRFRNKVDYGKTGKNRQGDYTVVGYTWVTEHVKGNPELAEIKTRFVKTKS